MACKWRGYTNKNRVLEVGENTSPPTTAASEFASCINSDRSRRFGYPPPLTGSGNTYSAWCLDEDESVTSVEPYDCDENTTYGYDCINGNCIGEATYNTPGNYPNLAACQAACSSGTPCDGECIPAAEITALNQAITDLQGRYCP